MTYRDIKNRLKSLLTIHDRNALYALLQELSPKELISPTISLFLDPYPRVRWRAITFIGELTYRLALEDMEKARMVMRRLMWQLNDESGGIGWGCPEAMGEIMARNPYLAKEFSSILVSYIMEEENFLDYPPLFNGALWGLARLSQTDSRHIKRAIPTLIALTTKKETTPKLLALLALNHAKDYVDLSQLKDLRDDPGSEEVYWNEEFIIIKVSQLYTSLVSKEG